jgi:hypothetical protein
MPLQQVAVAIEQGAPPLATERRDLPRRLLAAIDRALSPAAERRPRASELAAELRRALHRPERKPPARKIPEASERVLPAAPVLERTVPAALAGVAAIVGVSLLPFWPPALAVAIVIAVAAAAFARPRLGLALALATPVFPLGNVAQSVAVLYAALAAAWLVLFWREARLGLLFVTGPLLAGLGALGLVPLVAQPVRTPIRKGMQTAAAVLLAGAVAALSGEALPVGGDGLDAPDLVPGSSVTEAAAALAGSLLSQPLLIAGAALLAAVAVALPWTRRRSRLGVAALGLLVVSAAVAAGTGLASIPLLVAGWGVAAVLRGPDRSGPD